MKRIFRSLKFFAFFTVGISSCALFAPPPGYESTVWILDNADPDFVNPPFDDTLTVVSSDGSLVNTITGINITQTIRQLPAARRLPGRGLCPGGHNRSSRPETGLPRGLRGGMLELGQTGGGGGLSRCTARLRPDHNRYYQRRGSSPHRSAGRDGARGGGSRWVRSGGGRGSRCHLAGGDGRKELDLAMERQFVIDPIGWSAVSVDFTSDGSAWVAEQAHPDVPGSADRLLKIGPAGSVVQAVPLDFSPSCVRVDRGDDSLWVAGGGGVRKFGSDGTPLLSIPGPSFTLCIDQADGSAWAAGRPSSPLLQQWGRAPDPHGLFGRPSLDRFPLIAKRLTLKPLKRKGGGCWVLPTIEDGEDSVFERGWAGRPQGRGLQGSSFCLSRKDPSPTTAPVICWKWR